MNAKLLTNNVLLINILLIHVAQLMIDAFASHKTTVMYSATHFRLQDENYQILNLLL